MSAPIAVFAFNRPDHLRRTLEALAANDLAGQSSLTIFCDGPRNEAERTATEAVRAVARNAVGFASLEIVERESNVGCADSVIRGLEAMFSVHERLIVIEDDILCAPSCLRFLNTCLDKYADEKVIFNIAAWSPPPQIMPVPPGYPFDVYCIPRFNCWGWGTWKDRWQLVAWDIPDYSQFAANATLQQAFNAGGEDMSPMLGDQMQGKIDAWDIRADYARFKHGCVGLNPVHSYTTNIGMGSGTHTTQFTTRFDNDLSLAVEHPRLPNHIFVDSQILSAYQNAFKPVQEISLAQRWDAFAKKCKQYPVLLPLWNVLKWCKDSVKKI